MRNLFADGWNSVVHVVLGAAAATYSPILGGSMFVVYQLAQDDQENTVIDLLEFAIGWSGIKQIK
jgi:hypothetical protein